MSPNPRVQGFFDPATFSVQYILWCTDTLECAVIDPVLDFDPKSGATATKTADTLLAFIVEHKLKPVWILDTHPHADHFSAAHYLSVETGAPMATGEPIIRVQRLWQDIYNWPDFEPGDAYWDRLFLPGDRFQVGNLEAKVLYSPGHTLASVTYVVGNAAFIHDTLFMPDSGSARADFPGGDAGQLWASIQEILSLPEDTRLFTGHDYQPGGREPRWESTVDEQRRNNPHVAGRSQVDFVVLREGRDAILPMPKLILPALQVNIRGGRLPEPEENGKRYLKIPLDFFSSAPWE